MENCTSPIVPIHHPQPEGHFLLGVANATSKPWLHLCSSRKNQERKELLRLKGQRLCGGVPLRRQAFEKVPSPVLGG